MGGLRSSGTNALGLRGRQKYTLRQGPLDRREWGRKSRRELLERESVCSWADVLQDGRQWFQDRETRGWRRREVIR